jgi:hypothetical protein
MFNEQARNMTVNLLKRMEEILHKFGVKLVGSWNDMPAHEIYSVFETPSVETFMGMLEEPEMMAWLGSKRVANKVVLGLDEVKQKFGL